MILGLFLGNDGVGNWGWECGVGDKGLGLILVSEDGFVAMK